MYPIRYEFELKVATFPIVVAGRQSDSVKNATYFGIRSKKSEYWG